MNKFEQAARVYEKAIRWSDFERASAFARPPEGETQNLEGLSSIRVASYEVQQVVPSADKTRVQQSVKITYYRIHQSILKSLIDNQLWEYDDATNTWHVSSGLPKFR